MMCKFHCRDEVMVGSCSVPSWAAACNGGDKNVVSDMREVEATRSRWSTRDHRCDMRLCVVCFAKKSSQKTTARPTVDAGAAYFSGWLTRLLAFSQINVNNSQATACVQLAVPSSSALSVQRDKGGVVCGPLLYVVWCVTRSEKKQQIKALIMLKSIKIKRSAKQGWACS